ncbi:MAG: hypothetical protein LBV40_01180 [Methanomicrobiales archaeon]|nr:hypothetical protein [Methanomicrobiales archaeon]
MFIASIAANIQYIAYIQETIPKEAQGRAFSLVGSLMLFSMPVGLLIAGPAAEHWGVTLWFSISGILIIVIMLIGALFVNRRT